MHFAPKLTCLAMLLSGGCASPDSHPGAAIDAADQAATGADSSASAGLDGAADAPTKDAAAGDSVAADGFKPVSLAGAPTLGDDERAMQAVAAASSGSALAAAAAWPTGAAALWPGYHLHNLPIVLVPTNDKSIPVRAYLLHYQQVPVGAQAVADHPGVYRFDAAIAQLDGDEDTVIAGYSALTMRYVAADIADPVKFASDLAEQAMSRLAHYEAQWIAAGGCGANTYPRGKQALALWFLECDVLKEGLAASDPSVIAARLREVYAIRAAYGELNAVLIKMNDHYDNMFASKRWVALRLLRNAQLISPAQFEAQLLQWLDDPMTVPAETFDAHFVNDGTVRAAPLELAVRLGWDVEPAYRAGKSAMSLVPDKTGGEPAALLVEQAKQRHNWAAYLARAEALGGV